MVLKGLRSNLKTRGYNYVYQNTTDEAEQRARLLPEIHLACDKGYLACRASMKWNVHVDTDATIQVLTGALAIKDAVPVVVFHNMRVGPVHTATTQIGSTSLTKT
jgi:hypothetical protein